MAKFATWGEIGSKTGRKGSPDNRYPTKQLILNLGGLTVNGSYASNQYVPLSAVVLSVPLIDNYISVSINQSGSRWRAYAYASYKVTSAISIYGDIEDQFSSAYYHFSVDIPYNQQSGNGPEFSMSQFAQPMITNAVVYPDSDTTYDYHVNY